jgi:hypothetical protein
MHCRDLENSVPLIDEGTFATCSFCFSHIDYVPGREWLPAQENYVIMKVHGIFNETDNATDFLKIEVREIKYVKRITKQQARTLVGIWEAYLNARSSEDTD